MFGAGAPAATQAPAMTSAPDTSTWSVIMPDGTSTPYNLASSDELATNPQVVTPNGTFAYQDLMSAQNQPSIWGGSLFSDPSSNWTVTTSSGQTVPYNAVSPQVLATNPVVNTPSGQVQYSNLSFFDKLPSWVLPAAGIVAAIGLLAVLNGASGAMHGHRRSRRHRR